MTRQGRRARARDARRQQRRRRTTAYVALAGLVLALAVWLGARPLLRHDQATVEGEVFVVQADMAGFQPQVIRGRAGRPITVRLESLDTRFHRDGGGRHQFAIDTLGINIIAPPLGSRDTTFVVSEPGVYPFYCSICCGGRANPNMWGRLIVES